MSALSPPGPEPGPNRPGDATGDPARERAIRQIERRRRFHIEAAVSVLALAVVTLVWAFSEYHNAGGWPTRGFGQSSGTPHVWNYWIVYPLGAVVVFLGARAWFVYGNKPISESQIRREMERQSKQR